MDTLARSTADSAAEGRLKVDTGKKSTKKSILKKLVKNCK